VDFVATIVRMRLTNRGQFVAVKSTGSSFAILILETQAIAKPARRLGRGMIAIQWDYQMPEQKTAQSAALITPEAMVVKTIQVSG